LEIQSKTSNDSDKSAQKVRALNLDPMKSLLEKLKFELAKSLNYENDATNTTKKLCNNELEQQDKDLAAIDSEVANLTAKLDKIGAQIDLLTDQKNNMTTSIQILENIIADLDQKIKDKKDSRESKAEEIQQQFQTFQSIRDIITQVGGVSCTAESQHGITLQELSGVECVGDLQETQIQAQSSTDCIGLCGFGCAGFSFRSDQGCRFFSTISNHTSSCASSDAISQEPISCSCFQKVQTQQ